MSEKIGLIKIDVEGMEYDVLLEQKILLSKTNPLYVLNKIKRVCNNCNETNSIDLLRANGYKILVGEMEKDHMKQTGFIDLRKYFYFFWVTQNRIIKEYERLPKKDYKMIFAIHKSKF